MFKWVVKRENSNHFHELEFNEITDFYKKVPLYQETEEFSYSKLFKNFDYDIVVVKPVKDDFLILYANNLIWEFFGEGFSKYMEGRLIGELFPFFKTSNFIKHLQEAYKNDSKANYFFKMYEDENLIFAGKQSAVKQDDLLFVLTKDQTDYYLRRESEEKIFNKSSYPVLLLNNYGEITDVNDSFFKFSKYDIDELNLFGIENIFKTFVPRTIKVESFNEALKLMFENKLPVFDFEVEVIKKNKLTKWITVHMRLINDYTVRLTLRDIDANKRQKLIVQNLMDYFSDLEGSENNYFQVFDGENFHYSDNIYNIFEIDSKMDLTTKMDALLTDFILPEDKDYAIENIRKLIDTGKPVSFEYRIKTGKDNIKTLKTDLKMFGDNQVYYGFTMDKTTEYDNKKEMDKLQQKLNTIQSSSNIGISNYKNGMYYNSPEIYKILEIDSKDYITGEDLFKNLVQTDERDSWLNVINNLSPENPHAHKITTLKNAKGNLKIIDNVIDAEFDENGELLEYTSFVRDITEEELAKKEALRLTENFDLIDNLSKIALCEYENGEYSFTSEVYNILGLDYDNFIENVNIIDNFVVSEDKQEHDDYIFKMTPQKPNYELTYRIIDANGDLKYLNVQSLAIFDDKKDLIRVVGLLRDITDEVLAQNEANELKRTIDEIQGFSRIFLMTYENGNYTYTSEVYNILDINPEKYPPNKLIDFVIPEDRERIYEKYHSITPENPVYKVRYTAIKPNGEPIYVSLFAKGTFDENGEIIRVDGFEQDVTEETLAKNTALDLQDSINIIGGFSKIVIGYHAEGKYSWTPEIYNILEIKPDDFDDDVDLIAEFSTPEDNKAFNEAITNLTPENNTFSGIRTVYDNEGNLKYLNIKVVAEFDNDDEIYSLHKFIQDVTEEILTKESALDLQNNLSIIQESSKIVIAHYKNGEFSWTSEIYNILEINPEDYPNNIDLITYFTIPEEKNVFADKVSNLTPENPRFNNIATVKTVNGNYKYLEGYIEAKFDENGDLSEFVGFVHDETEKVLRENELKSLSDERKLLLQEVHHRVKNNLQLVSSFLSLDARYYEDRPEYVIRKTQTRIDAMATAHEEVYQSKDVSHINVESLLVNVLSGLFVKLGSKKIRRVFDIESDIYIDIDKAMPLSFFVSELAVNCINHAFPDGREGNFCVDLVSTDDADILRVWDDGDGLPDGLDIFSSDTLGFTVIRRLAEQLEAELRVLNNFPGFGMELIFSKC